MDGKKTTLIVIFHILLNSTHCRIVWIGLPFEYKAFVISRIWHHHGLSEIATSINRFPHKMWTSNRQWNFISSYNVLFLLLNTFGFNISLSLFLPSLQSLQEVQPQLQGKIPQSVLEGGRWALYWSLSLSQSLSLLLPHSLSISQGFLFLFTSLSSF